MNTIIITDLERYKMMDHRTIMNADFVAVQESGGFRLVKNRYGPHDELVTTEVLMLRTQEVLDHAG